MIVPVAEAARLLERGDVVAYPTETVYGLGADARSAAALARLCELKGRDPTRGLSVLVADVDAFERCVPGLPARARELARRFWPGPLTLVVPLDDPALAAVATARGVGFRCSPQPTAQALLRAAGCPLVSTSANRTGEPPARDVSGVEACFGKEFPVAGGEPAGGLEPSTVVAVAADGHLDLLREGALPWRALTSEARRMSEVRPFAGLRYARFAGPRIAPPYDVLDDADRAALARDPENLVHLTLPPGPSGQRDYAGAAALFQAWQRAGVLERDPEPGFYVLEERTTDGRTRRGFLALLRLQDYADRVVLPHERTMAGPKLDRLLLTREVRANLEPLFFLYEDRDGKLLPALQSADAEPALTACKGPDGTELAMRAITERSAIDAIAEFLLPRSVIIADGHHRYETMLTYRDECRAAHGTDPEAPHEFVLAYLVNAFDPGSRIQAIHRALTGEVTPPGAALRSAGFTTVTLQKGTPATALLQQLTGRRANETAFVLAESGGELTLAVRARGEKLDVEVLHAEVLPALGGQLEFDARPERLLERVRRSEIQLGILMNPLDPDTLFRVIQAGAILPQKSTYFAPKIPSGLVIRDF